MGFIKDMFSSPKPPPPVDYGEIGRQQTAANVESARLGARLGRPDFVTPYATTTFRETSPDQWLGTYSLAPEYEGLRAGGALVQGGLQTLGARRLGQVDPGAFDYQGITANPAAFDYGQFGALPTLDLSGTQYKLPAAGDLNTFTTNAANTYFNQALSRLQPEFDRAQTQLEDRLITSGIPRGTDAFNEELRRFNLSKGDTLSNLASEATFRGQDLAASTLANILTGRGQELAERTTQFDIAGAQRAQQAQEARDAYILQQQARDREIQERLRLRQQPMQELAAALTGTTPFTDAAAGAPKAPIQTVSGPAPVNLAGLAQAGAQDALQRYQGALQKQGAALSIPTQLASAWMLGA